MTRQRFVADRRRHIYRLNGSAILSVTDAIAGAGHIETRWLTEAPRRRGEAVHEILRQDDLGMLDEAAVPDVYRGYLQSYRAACEYCGFRWDAIESAHCAPWSPIPFAGRIDRVGRTRLCQVTTESYQRAPVEGPGWPCVVDIKTGPHQAWHGLQLAAYDMLWHGSLYGQAYRIGLYLSESGDDATVHIFDDRSDYREFLQCLTPSDPNPQPSSRVAPGRPPSSPESST